MCFAHVHALVASALNVLRERAGWGVLAALFAWRRVTSVGALVQPLDYARSAITHGGVRRFSRCSRSNPLLRD